MKPTALAGGSVNCRTAMLELNLSYVEFGHLIGIHAHTAFEIAFDNGTLSARLGDTVNDLKGARILIATEPVDDIDAGNILRTLHKHGGRMLLKDLRRICKVRPEQIMHLDAVDERLSIRKRIDPELGLQYDVAITAIGLRDIGVLDDDAPPFLGEAIESPFLLPEAAALHKVLEEKKAALLDAAKGIEMAQSGLTNHNVEETAAMASLVYARITQPSELPGPYEAAQITFQGLTNEENDDED